MLNFLMIEIHWHIYYKSFPLPGDIVVIPSQVGLCGAEKLNGTKKELSKRMTAF